MRRLPWIIAAVGLAIPLVGSGLTLWIPLAGWAFGLVALWAVGRAIPTTQDQRLTAGLILLPILVVTAFEGGWWLIPADVAWIVVEWRSRSHPRPVGPSASPPSA